MAGNAWRDRNPSYNLLRYARERCTRVSHEHYKFYGGKGIKCLLTWPQMKKLWERDGGDKLYRPSIERKDPTGHYEFDNCEVIELGVNLHRAREARRDQRIRWVRKDQTSAKRKPS